MLAQTINGLAIEKEDKYCDILESTRLDETSIDKRLDTEEEIWIKVHKKTRNKKSKVDKLASQKSIEILPKVQTNINKSSLLNTEINEIKKKKVN